MVLEGGAAAGVMPHRVAVWQLRGPRCGVHDARRQEAATTTCKGPTHVGWHRGPSRWYCRWEVEEGLGEEEGGGEGQGERRGGFDPSIIIRNLGVGREKFKIPRHDIDNPKIIFMVVTPYIDCFQELCILHVA